MHTEKSFYRVRLTRIDKWKRQFAKWMIKESSRNFSYDTCLSKFAQGWVRDQWNLQVEPRTISGMTLIKNPELTHTSANIYIWIPHPRDPEVGRWNLVSCKEVLLVSWWNILVLDYLSFSWGEEGFSCWDDDAGSDQWVVILSSNIYINKAI